MKSLLIAVAVIAVSIAGPAPVINSKGSPISAGPAIVDSFEPIAVAPGIPFQPIAIGPTIVDFPVSADGTAIPAEKPDVAPALVAPVEVSSAPLVQIILNINQPANGVAPAPVVAAPFPNPVSVVDVAPEPVSVVEVAAPQPAVVGTPVLPQPVIIPETLN